MRNAGKAGGPRIPALIDRRCEGRELRSEQRRERADADALRRAPEELPPRQVQIDLMFDVHGITRPEPLTANRRPLAASRYEVHCFVIVSSRLKITLATVV